MPSVLTFQDTLPQRSGHTSCAAWEKAPSPSNPLDWHEPTNLWVQFLYLCN